MRIETRSIDYVPLAERHGKVWHLWPVWFTGDAHLATVATGLIGSTLGLNFFWSAIAIVLGCAFGTFFMAFHSTQGPQLGLPQMIQSRPQFGYRGAILVCGVALVTYVGFNAFNLLLAGDTAHLLSGAPAHAALVLFALVALGLSVVGHDWIHMAQRVLAYVMIVALLAFTIGTVQLHFAPDQLSVVGFRIVPFLAQFFAAAAYQLSWSIYVSDYSRYLPPDVGVRASFLWTYLGALLGGAWMMLVGAVVGAVGSHTDVALAIQAAGNAILPGFGLVLLIAALLGLLTVTSLNFYGASLTLLSVADSIRPLRCTVTTRLSALAVVGSAALAIALVLTGDVITQFGDLLTILLYLFTPWTAINLVDFYVVRRGYYSVREIFNPAGMYGLWNWRGLVAYALGFVAMIPFFSTGLYTGPIAKALDGADLAMLIGLPVATGAYLLACRSFDRDADRAQAEFADLSLDGSKEAVHGAGPGRASDQEYVRSTVT